MNKRCYLIIELDTGEVVLISFADADQAREWEDANESRLRGTVRGTARHARRSEVVS